MRIGTIVKKWRLIGELPLKTVAAEIGIRKETLWNIESGKAVDGETLIKLIAWLCANEGEKNGG